MTQEEIIQLAKAYGFTGGFDAEGKILHDEAFVVAVTEAVDYERNACLKIAESMSLTEANMNKTWRTACRDVAEAIRARGEA